MLMVGEGAEQSGRSQDKTRRGTAPSRTDPPCGRAAGLPLPGCCCPALPPVHARRVSHHCRRQLASAVRMRGASWLWQTGAVGESLVFDRYVAGRTVAKSLCSAMPFLKWKTVVIADPICAPHRRFGPLFRASPPDPAAEDITRIW